MMRSLGFFRFSPISGFPSLALNEFGVTRRPSRRRRFLNRNRQAAMPTIAMRITGIMGSPIPPEIPRTPAKDGEIFGRKWPAPVLPSWLIWMGRGLGSCGVCDDGLPPPNSPESMDFWSSLESWARLMPVCGLMFCVRDESVRRSFAARVGSIPSSPAGIPLAPGLPMSWLRMLGSTESPFEPPVRLWMRSRRDGLSFDPWAVLA